MGEGAAVMVLEELEHAKKRGAKIYGEVIGYGASSHAYHITSPDPESKGAIRAMKRAIDDADIKPEEIEYINAHGTGTALNDTSETAAYKIALGEDAYKAHISSIKGSIGHMLGAAGAAEAVVSVLALKHGIVPPTINLDEPDPECDLDYTPNKSVETELDYAFSSSLGFGGHNACVSFRKVEA